MKGEQTPVSPAITRKAASVRPSQRWIFSHVPRTGVTMPYLP